MTSKKEFLKSYVQTSREVLGISNRKFGRHRSYESSIGLEMTYARLLKEYGKQWSQTIERLLLSYLPRLGFRQDQLTENNTDLIIMLDQLERQIQEQQNIERDSTAIVAAALLFANTRMRKNLSAVIGIPFPLASGDFTNVISQNFIRRNAELIQKLTKEVVDDVRVKLLSGSAADLTQDQVYNSILGNKKILDKVPTMKKVDNRLGLIGEDQVQKVHAEFVAAYSVESGIDEYIWRTMLDERVRGNPFGLYPDSEFSHWDREGEVFQFNNPPEDGNPGEPVNCRCAAEPNLNFLED